MNGGTVLLAGGCPCCGPGMPCACRQGGGCCPCNRTGTGPAVPSATRATVGDNSGAVDANRAGARQ